jgi:hypothetical protein
VLTAVDHLVIAVTSLDAAIGDYRALGFTVVPGGRHPGVGTENALIAFADTAYLELIGFTEPREDHRWWAALQRGGGLVDFCLQTDDFATDALALRRAGVDIGDPQPRERRRPDGVEVRWMFALARGEHRGVAPFVIADVTGRDLRVPQEWRHANGATGVDTVTVAGRAVAPVRGWYAQVLGRPGEVIRRPEIGGAGARFTFGPHAFEFLAPTDPRGPLADWIARRGSSPFAVSLRATAPAPESLDLARTRGVRLSFAIGKRLEA